MAHMAHDFTTDDLFLIAIKSDKTLNDIALV